MYAVQRLSSYISHGVYTVSGPFHPFGGAVDIIVVQQPDGSFKSSPWYVRFGKFQGVLKTKEKVVDISVNGTEAGFRMYLDHKGEAYFLREIDGDEGDGTFSPPSSGDEMDERSPDGRLLKAQSLNLVVGDSKSDTQNDMDSRNAVKRTSSQPSSLLGLVFRQKSTKTENTLGNGASEEGISTPDGVAISEDILDAKCSISRLADNEGADNASLLSGIVKVDEEADEDVQVSHHGFIQPTAHETVTTDVSSGLAIMDTQYSDEVTSPMHKRLSTHKQDLRLSASDMSELSYKHGAEQSTSINKGVSGVENAGFNQIANGLTSDATVVGSQGHGFADLEEGHTSNSNISTQGDMGLTPGERGSLLVAHVSEEESYDSGVSSYVYRETSVNMSLGIEGQCKEVEVHTEVLCKEAELISNRISQTESGLPFEEENPEGECHNPNGDHESDGISENSISKIADLGQMRTKSPYIDQLSSGPVESNIAEVIHQDTILIKETNLESGQIEAFENRSQMKDHSPPCLSGNNEVGDETSSPDSFDRTVEDEWMVDSVKEDETRPACISNTINQVQEGEDLGQVVKTQDFQLSFEASINSQESNIGSIPEKGITYGMQSTENLEEDDYLFNDLDNLAVSGSQSNEADSAAVEEIDHHMMESIEEEHELSTTNHESCLSSNRSFGSRSYSTAGSHTSELIQESSPTALEGSPRESGSRTNPITIPRSRLRETVVESVPNFLGHMHELGSYDILQPRSRSLDLGSTHSKWDLHRQSLISKAASESNLVEQHPTAEPAVAAIDNKSMEPHECLSLNLAVEISLCKHLLFEGMGAAAAAEAFDSEKVDLERFSTMGPSLVKNDKLVVRVGGRYFPWSAAAPIVLGMVCFGNEQILKPEGMISVDKSEKDVEGEAIVSSGGSWRLWPFSFRKSKAGNSVQLASKGNNGSEADNIASQIAGDNELNQGSTVKKLVRSEIPTSEQLASLDLNEGQNLITFTFSTAMLGKQQVDARIYLWKWNTRIVISDVDGTITKSDVLGQFMPLVGKDWSQSGVANLFSAIKENGYQLLFLSARAISQAYLTRQFLVNLKQDGKALPDGPVVISPDGLFPSLFREVIRRAPHEFKISCLEDIRALFPPDCNPFYAGFGNRDTDEISYLKVGIPKGKIFIINPKGEVAVDRWVDTKSYTSLHSLVNGIFPAMSSAEQEDFNSWNFWKMPLPKIDI